MNPKSHGGECGLQVVRAIAVLFPTLMFLATSIWTLWRPPAVRPSVLVSEAVLYFGFAALFNLAYRWFYLGYLARTITLVPESSSLTCNVARLRWARVQG